MYPFLFAAVGILFLAAENPGSYTFADLLVVLGCVLAGFALIYLAVRLAARGRAGGRLPALLTMLAVLWFFGLPLLLHHFPGGPANPQNLGPALLGLAASGGAALWLARRPERLRTAATFLTLTGGILVARYAADIGLETVRGRNALAGSALARELAQPVEGPAAVPAPRRDVYLLVLDEYANAAVLREGFGYDNRAFEDSLRALGFHIPAVVHRNYFHRNCGPPSRSAAVDKVRGYLDQLECVNSMVLDVVTRLLRDSEVPPVILIQSDHGTATLRYSRAPSARLVPAPASRERFGAFGAYYLPDSGEAAFGDTVTVVNVLGNVLRHYFGAELPREPDDRYLSLEETPYEFAPPERTSRASHPGQPGSVTPVSAPRRVRGGT